ncbi:MAG: glycoside hydrolase family 3 C-terminal domain-containing protein [candidate division KSB1 bacterium]|nr:glycoside hydrolase family 3 C-terminal domain-containing protein [candidate division KSB1 bacterium]
MQAQTPSYPFMDPNLPIEQRVEDLLSRLTLEEKVSQMMHDAPAIERLGIPKYNWWNECLHGVARAGIATVFPQAIGLAATWDTDLMLRIATAISDEARAKHHEFARHGWRDIYQGLTFWSPNINIFRDPRWGRGMETYGEDPFLTGSMAVQFIRGLQGDHPRYLKLVATAKHFAVHSGPEPERHTFDARVSERDLRDTYLPAFEMCVREAKVRSVMCAYNRTLGEACCASRRLIEKILREEWDFDGYVVSDCWAITDIWKTHRVAADASEASAMAVAVGTDLECGSDYRSLLDAVGQGKISEREIDTSLRRLLRARFELGMFDPPERVPYAQVPFHVNDCAEHRELALQAARESIVLLKNDGTLPLRKDLKRVAVIGPLGNDEPILLGNYEGTPADPCTILRGIREKLPHAEVRFSTGCDIADGMPAFEIVPSDVLRTGGPDCQPGVKATFYANRNLSGDPIHTACYPAVDFNWYLQPPIPQLSDGVFSARFEGVLTPIVSGTYSVGVYGHREIRFVLDGKEICHFDADYRQQLAYGTVELTAGRPYPFTIEYKGILPHSQHRPFLQLVWSRPQPEREKEALELARWADAVILTMGLSPLLEGEEMPVDLPGFRGGDRTDIALPRPQEELMKKVAAAGKPTVLVLHSGSAVAIQWAAENLPAIVQAWYPGQAGGWAVADVLFGDYNPGGRLPVTFYRSLDDLPPFEDYRMEGRTYRYFRGEPLFPFGYGLSYTRFAYSNLRLPSEAKAGEEIRVSVVVKNVGDRAGDEVVQLYITDLEASAPVPIRALRGFRRIFLEPGQSTEVEFLLRPRDLSLVTEDGRRVLEPGEFEISVGGKQPGFHGLADAATTEVLTGRLRLTGATLELP